MTIYYLIQDQELYRENLLSVYHWIQKNNNLRVLIWIPYIQLEFIMCFIYKPIQYIITWSGQKIRMTNFPPNISIWKMSTCLSMYHLDESTVTESNLSDLQKYDEGLAVPVSKYTPPSWPLHGLSLHPPTGHRIQFVVRQCSYQKSHSSIWSYSPLSN